MLCAAGMPLQRRLDGMETMDTLSEVFTKAVGLLSAFFRSFHPLRKA